MVKLPEFDAIDYVIRRKLPAESKLADWRRWRFKAPQQESPAKEAVENARLEVCALRTQLEAMHPDELAELVMQCQDDERRDRNNLGFFTVHEAIDALESKYDSPPHLFLEKIAEGARNKCFSLYHPNGWQDRLGAEFTDPDIELVFSAELNAWFESERMPCRLTTIGDNQPHSVQLGANEVKDNTSIAASGMVGEIQRKTPNGGDSLTPIIWGLCYDLYGAGQRVTPRPVMAELKRMAADQTHPLLGSVAGGVVYEYERGDERELNSSQLQSRINEWKKASKFFE